MYLWAALHVLCRVVALHWLHCTQTYLQKYYKVHKFAICNHKFKNSRYLVMHYTTANIQAEFKINWLIRNRNQNSTKKMFPLTTDDSRRTDILCYNNYVVFFLKKIQTNGTNFELDGTVTCIPYGSIHSYKR